MNALSIDDSASQSAAAQRGRLIDITRPEHKADPFPLYARLRESAPVQRARMGRIEGYLLTRYDDVLAALKDPRLAKNIRRIEGAAELSRRPWLPGFLRAMESNMLDQDDPNHARLRALVHRAFTPARIERLRPRIAALGNELLDRVQGRGELELIRDFALPLPLTVIGELLGVAPADRVRFQRLSQGALLPPTTLNVLRMLPSMWALIRYVQKLLAERRRAPQDDLLTALVQVEDGGDRLTADEQVAMVLLLLIAGHETTVNLISSGVLALLTHPEPLQRLRARPEGPAMKAAVEELLRFTCPVEHATERYAVEDLTLHGTRVRRGELVLAVLASANRDPAHFPRPDELDLMREPNRHLAFGYGIHFCLGAPLARMEGQIALELLLQRLPELRLAVPAETLRWRATPVVRGLSALPLRFRA
ncbi:MAG: cytochrome P450 [Polyangia bacterium]